MRGLKLISISSLVIALVMTFSMIMFSTLEVEAVPKAEGKTVYVLSQRTTTTSYNGLETIENYDYNENGILTGSHILHVHDNDKRIEKYTLNKNGDIVGIKHYIVEDNNGKIQKRLFYTQSLTYWKKGIVKKLKDKDSEGNSLTRCWDKYGNETSTKYCADERYFKNTLNKKHYPTKVVERVKINNKWIIVTTKRSFRYKYNKKGKVVKISYTLIGSGAPQKTTFVNTYNNRGQIVKSVRTISSKEFKTTKRTTKYKYKKITVNKKYSGYSYIKNLPKLYGRQLY